MTVTIVALATVPGVTVKVADNAPCGTVTVAGTLAPPGDVESAITVPPAGAAMVSPTVQVDVLGGVIATGPQERPFKAGAMLTTPPDAEVLIGAAAPSAALRLLRLKADDRFEAVAETVRDTVATTPVEMGVEFSPYSRQVIAPARLLQATVLPAAVAAGPAATVTDEKSAAVYPRVHCSAEGEGPGVFKLKFKTVEVPGPAAAEDKPKLTACPKQAEAAVAAISVPHTALCRNSL